MMDMPVQIEESEMSENMLGKLTLFCSKCGNIMDDATIKFVEATKGDREGPDICAACMVDMLQEAIDNIPDQSSRAKNGRAS